MWVMFWNGLSKMHLPATHIRHIMLITGMSGSGKTVAISSLEDLGYYCVDNFPPNLLSALIAELNRSAVTHLAIAIDIRSGSLDELPGIIEQLQKHYQIDTLFLTASDEVLIQRFSETRRKHPFSHDGFSDHAQDLPSCLQRERHYLSNLRQIAHVIDTSLLKSASLYHWIKDWLQKKSTLNSKYSILITLQSFGFKYAAPRDCDFIFDVRHLPNPFYDPALRPLTGLDAPVAQFLQQSELVGSTVGDITHFFQRWLNNIESTQRAYVSIGIGCTGGQHRSVYVVEALAQNFSDYLLIKRHRCL